MVAESEIPHQAMERQGTRETKHSANTNATAYSWMQWPYIISPVDQ